jgi:hypothetical protein
VNVTFTSAQSGAGVTKTITAATGSPEAITLTSGDLTTLGDGAITVMAIATDAAGNQNTGSTSFSLKAAAPAAVVAITGISDDTGRSDSDFITQDTTLVVGGTNGALDGTKNELVQISTDGTTWQSVTQLTPTTWSFNDIGRSQGTVNYRVRVVNNNGVGVENINFTVGNTASQTVVMDTSAPTGLTLQPIAGDDFVNPTEKASGFVVRGIAEAGSSIKLDWVQGGSSVIAPTTTALADGSWTIQLSPSQIP